MNKKSTALLIALVMMALTLALSGCENELEAALPSSSEPAPAAASEPGPTPEATPEPEPTPTPEPTPAEDFDSLFASHNIVDAMLEEDLMIADTTKAVIRSYNSATAHWKMVIDSLVDTAADYLPGADYEAFIAEQESWQEECGQSISAIQEESGDDADSRIIVFEKICDLYRERAYSICKQFYTATNEMPDLESILDVEPVG